MYDKKISGEEKAWEILATLKSEDVCGTASVAYDKAFSAYIVKSFGMDFIISLRNRTISSNIPGSDVLLGKLGLFFRLSILWYLISAKNIACTGRPVKLEHIRGGDIFTRGAHQLPLDALANKFGKDKNGFIEKGKTLGGEIEQYGDASLRLYPLPRIPVVVSLWQEDTEFPARADIFFDSTCDMQLPTDIIWSIAMLCVMVFE